MSCFAVKIGVNLILIVSLSLKLGRTVLLLTLLSFGPIGFATWLCSGLSFVETFHLKVSVEGCGIVSSGFLR